MTGFDAIGLYSQKGCCESMRCGLNFIQPSIFCTQVSKGKEEIAFYSIPEFEEWKESTPNAKSWKIKYYKGLGTSTPKEAKEYFADMDRHRVFFDYSGIADDEAISLVSSTLDWPGGEYFSNYIRDIR